MEGESLPLGSLILIQSIAKISGGKLLMLF